MILLFFRPKASRIYSFLPLLKKKIKSTNSFQIGTPYTPWPLSQHHDQIEQLQKQNQHLNELLQGLRSEINIVKFELNNEKNKTDNLVNKSRQTRVWNLSWEVWVIAFIWPLVAFKFLDWLNKQKRKK